MVSSQIANGHGLLSVVMACAIEIRTSEMSTWNSIERYKFGNWGVRESHLKLLEKFVYAYVITMYNAIRIAEFATELEFAVAQTCCYCSNSNQASTFLIHENENMKLSTRWTRGTLHRKLTDGDSNICMHLVLVLRANRSGINMKLLTS